MILDLLVLIQDLAVSILAIPVILDSASLFSTGPELDFGLAGDSLTLTLNVLV